MQELYVNARFLSQKITGVQRFALEVSRQLKISGHKVIFLCPKKVIHKDLAEEFQVKRIGRLNGTAWEQIDLPAYLKKRKQPLLLSLANTGPLSYTNQALVLHDLAFMKHPEWYSKKFKIWYHFLIPFLVKKVKTLFTVSEFSKSEIIGVWPELKPITVVAGNGLPYLAKAPSSRSWSDREFVICFSGNNSRKNAAIAIDAMNYVKSKDVKLLVLGRPNTSFNSKGQGEESLMSTDKVVFIGDVSDEELSDLYQNAKALIYPSFYEGFGLPPLEALSFDCPSILSDITVFREVYGDSALYAKVDDAQAIAGAIDNLLQDTDLREKLLLKGKVILEKHTFKKVSDRLINTLFNETK